MSVRGIISLFIFLLSFSAFAELDDSFGISNPFVVSKEELEIVRDEALPKELRQTPIGEFAQVIQASAKSLEQWSRSLEQTEVTALCIGETHSKVYRQILGNIILPKLSFKSLSLETTEETLQGIVSQHLAQKSVELLGAPFAPIMDAVGSKPYAVPVYGIEETQAQKKAALKEKLSAPEDKTLTRDGFIAKNFLEIYDGLGLNVLVYGANHCSNFDLALPLEVPMFRRVKNILGSKAKSVLLVPWSQKDHPLVAYFSAAGVEKKTFVIDDFSRVSPEVFNYRFGLVKYQQNFDTFIFVKDR